MKRRYVVDSSIAAKWFFPEIDSDRANLLRDGWKFGAIELVVPPLFLAEMGNLIWKRVALRRDTSGAEAMAFYANLVRNPPTLISMGELALRALDMALNAGHPMYDCFYVAAAESLGCDLITADERLAAKFSSAFPFIRRLSTI